MTPEEFLAATEPGAPKPSAGAPPGVPSSGRTPAQRFLDATGPDVKSQRTMDGDTLEGSSAGSPLTTNYRFAGIDAPESAQSGGAASQAFLDKMIKENGGKIRVGSSVQDIHGRTASVLHAGSKNLNLELVRAGHAQVYDQYLKDLDPPLQKAMLDARDEAQRERRGMWAQDGDPNQDPELFRREQAAKGLSMSDGHMKRPRADGNSVMTPAEYLKATDPPLDPDGPENPRMPRYGAAPDHAPQISGQNQYAPESGFLEHALGGLDYLGNISRSTIAGYAQSGGSGAAALAYGKQAYNKQRETTSNQMKDAVTRELGAKHPVRFGKDDGVFDLGDVGDVGVNLAIDIFTDPVTLLTEGAGRLAKSSGFLGKGAAEYKLFQQGTEEAAAARRAARGAEGVAEVGQAADAAVGAKAAAVDMKPILEQMAVHQKGVEAAQAAGDAAAESAHTAALRESALEFQKGLDVGQGAAATGDAAGGGIAKAVADAAPVIDPERAALTSAAKTWMYGKQAAGAALGGAYGLGASDQNSKPWERALDAGLGAAVGAFAGKGIEAVAPVLRDAADSMTNKYATWTRGSKFGNFASQRMLAIDGFDKRKEIAEMIRQGRLQALSHLEEGDRLQASLMMQDLKTKTIEMRNKLFAEHGIEDGTAEANESMRMINDHMSNVVLPQLAENRAPEIVQAVKDWGQHNDDVIQKLNSEAFGIHTPGEINEAVNNGKGIVGLRFHIDDVYKVKEFEGAEKHLIDFETKIEKAMSEMRADSGLSRDESYAIYAEKFAGKFLNKAEKQAMELVREYHQTAPIQGYMGKVEKGLHAFDSLTNFIKGHFLYNSLSWVKNNYFDNMMKAYVENGLPGIVGSATTGAIRDGVSRDVWRLLRGNISMDYKAEHFASALKHGVLDNPQYKSIASEMARDFLFAPGKIAKANDSQLAKYIKNTGEVFRDKNPLMKLMSMSGSYMESTARMMTYVQTLEKLKANPLLAKAVPEAVERMAASIVKKTFFDYGNVTALEKATIKRLVPFYSFYSKNIPYWIQATFDPERAARVLNLEKLRTSIGTTPTGIQQKGMSPYVANNAPRSLGKDSHGNERFMISPSTSYMDALKMVSPKDMSSQAVEKGNPIPKMLYQLMSGNDLFSGDALYASQQPGGKKFLFSRGFKWYAAKEALTHLGFDPEGTVQSMLGTGGVKVDHGGNPYTTSNMTTVLDTILSTLYPMGAIDQIAGHIGKVGYDKESLDETLFNRVLPFTKVKVSPAYARMVRMRKAAEDRKAKEP